GAIVLCAGEHDRANDFGPLAKTFAVEHLRSPVTKILVFAHDSDDFASVDLGRDNTSSARGSGHSGFSVGLWQALARDGCGVGSQLQPKSTGGRRLQSDHSFSDSLANGPSARGACDFRAGFAVRLAFATRARRESPTDKAFYWLAGLDRDPNHSGCGDNLDQQIR